MVQAAATRQDIPDYLLFPDDEAFTTAGSLSSPEKFRHAIAKAWKIGLDQRGGGLAFPIRDWRHRAKPLYP